MAEFSAGSRRCRPAVVRFYLDADILGLAKLLVRVRSDMTFPGDPGGVVRKRQRPPCVITDPATLDKEWIPRVTAQQWLIVTRDSHIQDNRAEIDAVRENGARMVVLAGRDAVGTWKQLELFMLQWQEIEGCLIKPGPFIYAATRTTFHPVKL